jgi:Fur family transcriptional regulator, ferric uptake regulator
VSGDLHDAVQARLRAIGQRYTPKRRALVEALVGARNPVAVPQLTHGREMPQSSLYRNLAVLEQAGAVHRVVTQGEFTRYELAEDLTDHHHHLVCRNCGTVEDVAVTASLERQVQRSLVDVEDRTGFSAVSHRLDLIGICRNCA